MAKKKSKFYHVRRKVGLNVERAAEVLGCTTDEVEQFDAKGAPVMVERLLLLWDRKNVGVEGWEGWLFSRGVLVNKAPLAAGNDPGKPKTSRRSLAASRRIIEAQDVARVIHSFCG